MDIRIAVVEDHPVSRNGMVSFINSFPGFQVTIEAENGESLLRHLREGADPPDLCLMDIKMPGLNGYETTAILQKEWPSIKVIAMSVYDNEQIIIKMLRHGARGYILKEADASELRIALQSVYENDYYYSELVSGKLVDKIKHQKKLDRELNLQEIQFLAFCCLDLSYAEIADRMHVSVYTVDNYRAALFEKLDIKSRAGLAVYALSMGLGK